MLNSSSGWLPGVPTAEGPVSDRRDADSNRIGVGELCLPVATDDRAGLWLLSLLLPHHRLPPPPRAPFLGSFPGTRPNETFPILISAQLGGALLSRLLLCHQSPLNVEQLPAPSPVLSSPASCLEVLIQSLRRLARGLLLTDQSNASFRNCQRRHRLQTWKTKNKMPTWFKMEVCAGSFPSSFNSEKNKVK